MIIQRKFEIKIDLNNLNKNRDKLKIMVTKYYAVVSGKTPGIYTDWKTAESMVKGYPGAVFKSFTSENDAKKFMTKSTIIPKSNVSPRVIPLLNKTIIYTDGSYKKEEPCGFGLVAITSNNDIFKAYGKVPMNPTNNVAELYAIYVGLSMVRGNVVLYSDSQYAISTFTTYIHDWKENGWKGVANRSLIEAIYKLTENREVQFEKVPAHSGIKYNEEADELANQGRICNEDLVIIKNGIRIT